MTTLNFTDWGGSVAFDIDANWHFNSATNPTGGKVDFYSVALHELAHALGFGATNEWDSLVSGTTFIGAKRSSSIPTAARCRSAPPATPTIGAPRAPRTPSMAAPPRNCR